MGLQPEQTPNRRIEYRLLPHTLEAHTQLPPLWEGKESLPILDMPFHDSQTLPLPLYLVISIAGGTRR